MTVNIAELELSLAYTKEHLGTWSQDDWNHCFAGQTVKRLGLRKVETVIESDDCACCRITSVSYVDADGKDYGDRPSVIADRIFGLEDVDHGLFLGNNTITDIEMMIERMIKELQPA